MKKKRVILVEIIIQFNHIRIESKKSTEKFFLLFSDSDLI